MRFATKTIIARVIIAFSDRKAAVARCIRNMIEARKRTAEYEKEFYRKLDAYCQANNLSPVCADDWKTHV
jgi:hypothetical protein